MRIGSNPAKDDKTLIKSYGRHRVIVPVYIPHQNDYFKDALQITLFSLESLYLTARGRVSVTVVSNGCDGEVVAELLRLQSAGYIEQLIIDDQNRGKVNAVLSVARGAHEPFITIADADFLYLPGWVESSEQILADFPECGFVAVGGKPKPKCRHTSSAIVGAWLRRELRFKTVMSLEYLQRYTDEGQSETVLNANRVGQMVVQRGEKIACIGGNHRIFTVRREAIDDMRRDAISEFYGAENDWIDTPLDVAGWWRLSPTTLMARHMGNTLDTWIYQEIERIRLEVAAEKSQADDEKITDGPVRNRAQTDLAATRTRRHWSRVIPWPIRKTLARWIRQASVPKSERAFFQRLR